MREVTHVPGLRVRCPVVNEMVDCRVVNRNTVRVITRDLRTLDGLAAAGVDPAFLDWLVERGYVTAPGRF